MFDYNALDKIEKIVFDSTVTLAILANPASGDLELVRCQDLPLSEDKASDFFGVRGLAFIGAVGFLPNGTVRTALELPLDEKTSEALAAAVVAYLRVYLDETPKPERGDAVAWLERLHVLRDTRD